MNANTCDACKHFGTFASVCGVCSIATHNKWEAATPEAIAANIFKVGNNIRYIGSSSDFYGCEVEITSVNFANFYGNLIKSTAALMSQNITIGVRYTDDTAHAENYEPVIPTWKSFISVAQGEPTCTCGGNSFYSAGHTSTCPMYRYYSNGCTAPFK